MGQSVRGGQGGAHGVLQGPEVLQDISRELLPRRDAAGAERRRGGGGRQLHQEEARVPPAPGLGRRVPAAGARRGRDGVVAGRAAHAHAGAAAAQPDAARAQHRAQAPLLLHAQEEVS